VDLLIPRPSSELPGEVVPPTHDRPAAAERADGAIHDRRGDHLFAEPVDTAGGRLGPASAPVGVWRGGGWATSGCGGFRVRGAKPLQTHNSGGGAGRLAGGAGVARGPLRGTATTMRSAWSRAWSRS